jgi:histidinol-phosphate aminotransferase
MDDQDSPRDDGFTRLVRSLPSTAPFVGPEALERANGRTFALRLGANESNFGPSPQARAAMRAAVERIEWYADPEAWDTRSAIAAHLGVGIEHIGIGAGIDDLLGQVVRLYLEPGSQVVASLGSYPTFGFHVAGFGGRIERIPYRNDRNDLDALALAAQRTHASLVYLANPDNPSGSWSTGAEIAAFLDALPPQCVLLLDEAYLEFAPAEAQMPVDAANPRIVRFRTFSKAYGMAGARIGYLLAAPATVRALDKVRLHFGVNTIAHAGAQAALADQSYLAEVVAEVARGREEYAALAHELDLIALPSATNFVTIDVGGVERARATVAALAAAGVFIRMPGAAPLDRCIRVTIGAAADRQAFARIFREVWPQIANG